jgi:hypothetical protein
MLPHSILVAVATAHILSLLARNPRNTRPRAELKSRRNRSWGFSRFKDEDASANDGEAASSSGTRNGAAGVRPSGNGKTARVLSGPSDAPVEFVVDNYATSAGVASSGNGKVVCSGSGRVKSVAYSGKRARGAIGRCKGGRRSGLALPGAGLGFGLCASEGAGFGVDVRAARLRLGLRAVGLCERRAQCPTHRPMERVAWGFAVHMRVCGTRAGLRGSVPVCGIGSASLR